MPMDGNDGVERIMRTSPMGKNKAVEKFSKDFPTASIYLFNKGYLHLIYPILSTKRSLESIFEFIE